MAARGWLGLVLIGAVLAGCNVQKHAPDMDAGNADARQHTAPVVTRDPRLQQAMELLDAWRGDGDRLDQAQVLLNAVLADEPDSAEAHREYARFFIMSGFDQAAEQSINNALAINPKFAEAYVLLGHLYTSNGDFERGREALEKAEQIGTHDLWLHANWADLLMKQGDLDGATLRYERVLASGHKQRKVHIAAIEGLIDISIRQLKMERADQLHQLSIKTDPDSAWLYGNYGNFLMARIGDIEGAIVQYRKALDRMQYGNARSGLAAALYTKWAMQVLGEAPGDPAITLREAKQIADGDPREIVGSNCCVTWGYRKTEEAVEALRTGVSRMTEMPEHKLLERAQQVLPAGYSDELMRRTFTQSLSNSNLNAALSVFEAEKGSLIYLFIRQPDGQYVAVDLSHLEAQNIQALSQGHNGTFDRIESHPNGLSFGEDFVFEAEISTSVLSGSQMKQHSASVRVNPNGLVLKSD